MSLASAYLDLITSQHRGKPRYEATVAAVLKHTTDIYACAVYLDDYFDVDEAIGKQLDVLGEIVGAKRTLNFQPRGNLSPVLEDPAYRNLIKAKIAQNLWKGGIDDLYGTWLNLFGNGIVIEDKQDMTITVVVIGMDDEITQEMIMEGLIVPKPQSVRVNFMFSSKPVFGYDMETDTIRGYDHADWVVDFLLPMFSYDYNDSAEGMLGYDEGYWR